MRYRTERDFDFLSTENSDIFFIDIEGTLFTANMHWEMLLDKSFYRLFLMSIETNNIIEHKMSDIMYVGKNFIRGLTDSRIPEILAREQRKGKKIIALSSGFKSSQKLLKFKQLGISFDELLFTQRKDKGDFLVGYLQKSFLQKPDEFTGKTILILDDHIHKLDSMHYALKNADLPLGGVKLVLYNNDYVHDLSVESFEYYWRNVVRSMDKFPRNRKYTPKHLNNEQNVVQ